MNNQKQTTKDTRKEFSLITEKLTKKYDQTVAVSDFSISAQPGRLVVLLGPNGSGKSTLMKMICGLLRPTSGIIKILGKPYLKFNAQIRIKIGYSPQDIMAWKDLTTIEQLKFATRLYQLDAKEADKQIQTVIQRLGLGRKAGTLVGKLSGGMQRRLNLALAIIHNPSILVLDEPFSGLDPQGRVFVRDYIKELTQKEKKTILLSTHNINEAEQFADDLAIMDQGKLLTFDTLSNLKKETGKPLMITFQDEITDPVVLSDLKRLSDQIELNANVIEKNHMINQSSDPSKIARLMDFLAQKKIKISQLKTIETTLEEIFISLTGRSINE